MMKLRWSALGAAFLLSFCSTPVDAAELAIWNVGQGQWATWIDNEVCYHFDIGGEYAPLKKIREACRNRSNFALFSHWDWDHVGMVRRAARNLQKFCVLVPPAGPSSAKARTPFNGIPVCDSTIKAGSTERPREPRLVSVQGKYLQLIHELPVRKEGGIRSKSPSPKNSASRVFELNPIALLPGDSPTTQERFWIKHLRFARSIRILVLGHHGSRTSTSPELLSVLRGLKQAIASARHERYGHPHASVVKRLKEKGIALLKTEDWGSIRIEVRRMDESRPDAK